MVTTTNTTNHPVIRIRAAKIGLIMPPKIITWTAMEQTTGEDMMPMSTLQK